MDADIGKMKVADLKKELKVRNLSTAGNKNELVERLQAAMLEGETILDDGLLDDDMLNDDEFDDDVDAADDDVKSLLDPSLEESVLKTPPESKSAPVVESPSAGQKKVVLKRKLITSEPDAAELLPTASDAALLEADDLHKSTSNAADDKSAGVTPKKQPKIPITAPADDDGIVIKQKPAKTPAAADGKADDASKVKVAEVAKLSYQERLELRAKRFGLPAKAETAAEKPKAKASAAAPAASAVVSSTSGLDDAEKLRKRAERFGLKVADDDAAKLAARAARFGLNGDKPADTAGAKQTAAAIGADPELLEKMRKRAERFGGSVSKVMLLIESQEKLKQRQERFNETAGKAKVADAGETVVASSVTGSSDVAAVSAAE